MQSVRRGSAGPAVLEVRAALRSIGLLPGATLAAPDPVNWDDDLDLAIRSFQQARGLSVDGIVGIETWRALEAARHRLGDRVLHYSVRLPYVGDDVAELQRRLLRMGFDVGRIDGIFGPRTDAALREFQRNVGLLPDGTCGPATLRALDRLRRTVSGGRPAELRQVEILRHRGPTLSGAVVVVDPAHGGGDPGWTAHGAAERDIVADVASRLEGRLAASGVTVFISHGPDSNPPDAERAEFANAAGADVFLSLHTDGVAESESAHGVATYYYGTGRDPDSVVGERLAELVQREIVMRTDLLDCRTHPKAWDLLRLTRMPAVRVELGYLTSPRDARRLRSAEFRDTVAEAMHVAIARLFLPPEADPPTGALRLPLDLLRAASVDS